MWDTVAQDMYWLEHQCGIQTQYDESLLEKADDVQQRIEQQLAANTAANKLIAPVAGAADVATQLSGASTPIQGSPSQQPQASR